MLLPSPLACVFRANSRRSLRIALLISENSEVPIQLTDQQFSESVRQKGQVRQPTAVMQTAESGNKTSGCPNEELRKKNQGFACLLLRNFRNTLTHVIEIICIQSSNAHSATSHNVNSKLFFKCFNLFRV